MKYNPDIHHRKSIRLKGYDYSSEGLYFITICTQNKEYLFGEIVNGEMILNGAGLMVEKIYKELSIYFKNINFEEYVIMPNHFHCMIEIINNQEGGKTPPLPEIIGYFKFQTTKKYNETLEIKNERFLPLWQRNYYENIIRNEKRHLQVIEYIENNPLKWKEDKYYL